MRIYFFNPLVSTSELSENYKKIAETLRAAGIFAVSSSNENNTDFKKEDLERMNEAGEILLDKMDGLVIEASKPDQEIGYLLAYAISQKKPLLYLYQKGTPEKVAYGYLTKKNIPNFVQMQAYGKNDLEQILKEWISTMGGGLHEKPNIKFTLRITPRIEQYLSRQAKQKRMSKADYLRELIEGIIKKEDNV